MGVLKDGEYTYAWITQVWGIKLSSDRLVFTNIGRKYPLAWIRVNFTVDRQGNDVAISEVSGYSGSLNESGAIPPVAVQVWATNGKIDLASLKVQVDLKGNLTGGTQTTTSSASVSAGVGGGGKPSASASYTLSVASGKNFSINSGGGVMQKKWIFTGTGRGWKTHMAGTDWINGARAKLIVTGGDEEEYWLYNDMPGYPTWDKLFLVGIGSDSEDQKANTQIFRMTRASSVAPTSSRFEVGMQRRNFEFWGRGIGTKEEREKKDDLDGFSDSWQDDERRKYLIWYLGSHKGAPY